MIYIGIDDTDNLESRGTGRLARDIAARLTEDYHPAAVTRHQLLVDSRIPYTSHNSAAAICLQDHLGDQDLADLFSRLSEWILADFQPGSDPGICLVSERMPASVAAFGRRAQQSVVLQEEARQLARQEGLLLQGLGGSEDGIIGALAAVGLAASGEDGRYLLVGQIREIAGLVPIEQVLASGVREVRTLAEQPLAEGPILADKLRPARRGGQPIQYVEWGGEYWIPVKLN
jgi:tRNA(Ile2) C34 agmatinyltransferase TiaS